MAGGDTCGVGRNIFLCTVQKYAFCIIWDKPLASYFVTLLPKRATSPGGGSAEKPIATAAQPAIAALEAALVLRRSSGGVPGALHSQQPASVLHGCKSDSRSVWTSFPKPRKRPALGHAGRAGNLVIHDVRRIHTVVPGNARRFATAYP